MPLKNHTYLIGMIVLIAFGGLAIWSEGWKAFWSGLSLPSMSPPFADMRTIQGALITISQGLDPSVSNPGDPWARLMNYPKIWISIASLLDFGQESHFIAYNLSILAGFYALCGYLLWHYPSKALLLMILTPACLLAVERGNNDLLIFTLVTLFVLLGNLRGCIAGALAIALKIYPVALIPLAFATKNRLSAWLFTLAAVGIIWANLADLNAIKNGNTANGDLAYGTTIAATLAYRNFGPAHFYWDTVLYPATIAATLLFTQWLRLYERLDALRKQDRMAVDLFFAGATIFFFTFTLSSNWDYRLIYLILLMPALGKIDAPKGWGRLLKFLLLACGSFLWLSHYPLGWFVSGYAKIFTATLCGYLTLRLFINQAINFAKRYLPCLA
jgi:hypothetical protein